MYRLEAISRKGGVEIALGWGRLRRGAGVIIWGQLWKSDTVIAERLWGWGLGT